MPDDAPWEDLPDEPTNRTPAPAPAARPDAREAFLRRQAVRGVALFALVAAPLALLLFLFLADWFDSYAGRAACHHRLGSGDGEGDRLSAWVLQQADRSTVEVPLPPEAFADYRVPACRSATPTAGDDAPMVRKDLFSLHVTVGERTWPTAASVDLLLPLLLALGLGLPIRNWVVTGSPFRLAGRVEIPSMIQPTPGRPAPSRKRSVQGPPPQRRKRGRR